MTNPWTPNLQDYLEFTHAVSNYKGVGTKADTELWYLAAGIAGEAGETSDQIKKMLGHWNRDKAKDRHEIGLELGDVLFHVVRLMWFFGYTPEEIIKMNIDKLTERYENGTIHSVKRP
jgi:NTP pyrophosphatase (non-canonical NTP hydrolase)